MIFTNARLIFPDAICDGLELVTEEGKITAIREQTQSGGEGVINLQGNYLAPGFIDLHVHGALGRDTMEASAEAFRAICDFHASGGTTSLLLTTATAPIEKLVELLKAARNFRPSISSSAACAVSRIPSIACPPRAVVESIVSAVCSSLH